MENMLKEALRKITDPLGQFLTNLAGDYGENWLAEFKKFLRKEPCWGDVKIISDDFDFLSIAIVPALTDKFMVREHFIVDISDDAEVRICFINQNFSDRHMDEINYSQGQKKLCFYNLLGTLSHGSIMNIFTESKCVFVTTPYDIWTRMKNQPHGEFGDLMTNGRENVFCISRGGEVSFMIVYWNLGKKGWSIEEIPFNPQRLRFAAGARFFIRY